MSNNNKIPTTLYPEDFADFRRLHAPARMHAADWLRLAAIILIATLAPLAGIALVVFFK